MSEADADTPVPPPEPARTLVNRTTTGAMIRWEAPAAELLADSFPGLKVRALCGVGGMGAVYRAEQTRLGRVVAVKILPSAATLEGEARERFAREARILSGLNHPHVLHIHDFGALPDGTLYLVMEWAEGGDLAKLLGGKAQPVPRVREWVRQIAEALGAAHGRGVIHRDLKPANVLVLEDGRLTLADFGLAHAGGGGFTTALTTTGAIFGTFEYMAPEQMESAGKVTPATDLYALGVMTYQMLTGRVPRGAYARPSRLANVPSEVDAFLDAAMANDAARRPKDAAEFVRRFEHACRAPQRRRHRQLIGLGVALVGLALAWARAEVIQAERKAAAAEERAEEMAAVAARARAARPVPAPRPAEVVVPPIVTPVSPPVEVTPPVVAPPPAAAVVVPEPVVAPKTESEAPAPATPPAAVAVPPLTEPGAAAAATASEPKPERPPVPWTWVLPEVKIADQAISGDWKLTRGELVSGEGRCVLSLPVKLAINYDVAVEFTRNSGKNSVALFLPTLSGVGTFEVDAWDLGIAGLQLVDGSDMRRLNRYFPAQLKNGEVHRLIIEVRGDKVSATWDGEPRMSWALEERRLRIPPLWQVRPEVGLGVGSWMSPTTFHRIAYRAWPADMDE